MVFIRNVTRSMRLTVLSKCINPRHGGVPPPGATCSIASFPSWTPTRTFHMTGKAFESISSISSNAALPTLNINESLGLTGPTSDTPETETARASIPVERLMESAAELVKLGSTAPMERIEEVFKGLADNRDFSNSYTILKQLREIGIKPSSIAYSHVARSGRRTLRAKEIRLLFGEELPRETMARSQGQVADSTSPFFEQMQEVLTLMKADGAELTQSFYEDLAFGLGMAQQGGLLINIAVAMEKRGIQPSAYFYNKMLHTLPRCGLADRADVLFSRMILNNFADQSSYVVRLGTLVFLGRVADAENCFQEMSKIYGLNEIACNTMINGYLHERRVEDALKVLNTMKEGSSLQPSNVTANTFVSYYYNSGDLTSAPAVLEYFGSLGYPSLPVDHANLFKLFARNDQPRAEKMLEALLAMDKPLDILIYNSILVALADRQVPSTFRQTIASLVVPKMIPIKPDGLAGICINTHNDMRQVIARMENEGVTPNSTTYDLAMRALRSRNDFDAIIHAFRHLMTSGQVIQNGHRNYYLGALITKGDSEELRTTVQNMVTRRHSIHDYNSRRLLDMGIEVPLARTRSLPGRSDRTLYESQGQGGGEPKDSRHHYQLQR